MQIKQLPSHQRKVIADQVRQGHLPLRVVGSQQDGFTLVAERPSSLITLQNGFKRQKDAISVGQQKFGQVARKKKLS